MVGLNEISCDSTIEEAAADLEELEPQDDCAGMQQELDRMRALLELGERDMNRLLGSRGPGSQFPGIPISIKARAKRLGQACRFENGTTIRTSSVCRKGDLNIYCNLGETPSFEIRNCGRSAVALEGWMCAVTLDHRRLRYSFPAGTSAFPGKSLIAGLPTTDYFQYEPYKEMDVDLLNPAGKLVANCSVELLESDAQN